MSEASVNALAAVEIGVPDLDAAASFYENIWGLSPVDRTDEVCYVRAAGADYYVLALHHRASPCFIRLRLGAENCQTVDALADRVNKAEGGLLNSPGRLSTPGGGYGFAFLDPDGREYQVLCDAQTHAIASLANDRPYKLSHVVLNSLDFNRASAFLRDALGFRLRDRTHKASFMGCSADHHSIAVTDRRNSLLSHVAYELPGLDAVLRGCGRLKRAGLKIEWGVGRHGTGDNVFAYYVDPNGFAIEYTTEMQQIDDRTYVPGSPETIVRAAHSDVWGLADPPTKRLLQAFQGPGASGG
jgi:catechol 2,3-dioxygenase-like lactoylglutathione lyase family enzyme